VIQARCDRFRHRQWSGLRSCYARDIDRFLHKGVEPIPNDTKHRLSAIVTPELLAILLYRVSHLLYVRKYVRLARLISVLNLVLHKTNLPPETCIGPGFHMPHPAGIYLVGSAGCNLTVYSMATCGPANAVYQPSLQDCPRLADDVTLGAHSTVMGPIEIGRGVKAGHMAGLTRDIPADSLVMRRAAAAVRSPSFCL
jgi:serine O-acetyltransferase